MVLVVLFMIAGLWELRVDFATINLHIPLVTLWICSTVTLLAVYFYPRHVVAKGIKSIQNFFILRLYQEWQPKDNCRLFNL